ncbi:hypothetical protein, partial [Acinetobacter faecalis]|uniref:hypothetical protein n=1 Tax=Acinetobacter faecalis TaxID=2665161 RepID=UPI002A91B527
LQNEIDAAELAEARLALEESISKANDLLSILQSQDDIDDLNAAIDKAELVLSKSEPASTKEELYGAKSELDGVIEILRPLTELELSKAELLAAIDAATSTSKDFDGAESIAAKAAIDVAKQALIKSTTTAEELEKAKKDLNDEISRLSLIEGAEDEARENLLSKIDTASVLSESKYLNDTEKQNISNAIDTAKSKLDATDLETLLDALENLNIAIETAQAIILERINNVESEKVDIKDVELVFGEGNKIINAEIKNGAGLNFEGKTLVIVNEYGDEVGRGTINNGVTVISIISVLPDNSKITYFIVNNSGDVISEEATQLVPDITSPDALKAENVIFLSESQIIGLVDPSEKGGVVQISSTLSDGSTTIIDTAIIKEDGSFEFNLDTALSAGTILDFVVIDSSTNKSPVIKLPVPMFSDNLVLEEDVVSTSILLNPIEQTLAKVKTNSGSLVQVGVGGILDLGLIDISEQFVLDLTGNNQTVYDDISVKITSYAVLNLTLGSTAYVYYRENESQDWVLHSEEILGLVSLLGIPLVSDSVSITNPKVGQYMVLVGSTGVDANVIGAMTIESVTPIVKKDYSAEIVKGNVLSNDTITSGSIVDSVEININGTLTKVEINGNESVSINGEYGVLTIDKFGSYSYQMFENNLLNVGKVDTFTYAVGNQTQKLHIQLNSAEYTNIKWDDDNPGKDATVLDLVSDANVLSVENALIEQIGKQLTDPVTSVVKVYNSLSSTYSVTSSNIEQAKASDYLQVTLSKTGSNPRESSVQILDSTGKAMNLSHLKITVDGKEVSPVTGDSFGVLLKGEIRNDAQPIYILIDGLEVGSYSVKTTAIDNSTYTLTQTVTTFEKIIDLNKNSLPKETGNLFDNDVINLDKVTWRIQNSEGQSAEFTSGVTASQTIKGLYGDLVLKNSGEYTYTLNNQNGLGKTEQFEYSVSDATLNLNDSNTLTIVIPNNSSIATETVDEFVFKNSEVDLAIFNVLNQDLTLEDTIKNFEIGTENEQGDIVDISALLDDAVTEPNITDYMFISVDGDDLILSVDRDGNGTTYQEADLLKLEGIAKDGSAFANKTADEILKQLLDNNQIVF